MINTEDTIVACSSPPGSGAVSCIRVSGKGCSELFKNISGYEISHKEVSLCEIQLKGGFKEKCVLTIFRSPNSYTGENVVEISTHGNPLIVEKVIQQCVNAGAFIAEPGEFTLRAYLNNKLSIDQSEAVIEVINANSLASLKAAQNSLNGGLRMRISKVQQKLREARVLVETLIDFVDEDVDIFIEEVKDKIDEFKRFFRSFDEDMKAYSSISNDVKVVVIGLPNSGKSTLINAIIGDKVSIVSEKAGTTRDVVSSACLIGGVRFLFKDTAGIRESSNEIEEEGIKLSKRALKSADIVLYLAEKESDFKKLPVFKGKKNIFIVNKIDINKRKAPIGGFAISAKTKKNLKSLKEELVKSYLSLDQAELLSVNLRHLNLIKQALKKISLISPSLIVSNLELVAENLKNCDELLGDVYDPISSDDMLGQIFNRFCIGK